MSQSLPAVRWMTIDDLAVQIDMAFALWPQLDKAAHRRRIEATFDTASKCRSALASLPDVPAAGFMELSIREYADGCENQPVPYLEGIWVDPDCRRTGVGRALIAFAEKWAREEGFSEICSDADLDNVLSHESHAGWGFSETSRIINFRKAL